VIDRSSLSLQSGFARLHKARQTRHGSPGCLRWPRRHCFEIKHGGADFDGALSHAFQAWSG